MNTTKPNQSKPDGDFAHRLMDWYIANARTMPWRVTPHDHSSGVRADPYHVWLSEVMLQQTQVVTVHDYFLKFVDLWPRLEDLAASDLEDVLKAWAGLGYYSRARNLKKCADIVVEVHDGRFPETFEELKTLPGIGDYTASAIAAIAFDQAVPVLDGNVERVLARHRRIETPFPKAKPEAKSILKGLVYTDNPGEFAQATMDLGAMICTPKRPSCQACPVRQDCRAFANTDVERFPIKLARPDKPVRKGAAFVIRNADNKVFLCKRPPTGLLAGMTQVPTTGWTARQDGETGSSSAPVKARWRRAGTARHTFTHFHIELEAWVGTVSSDPPFDGWWCDVADLDKEALPKVIHRVLDLCI